MPRDAALDGVVGKSGAAAAPCRRNPDVARKFGVRRQAVCRATPLCRVRKKAAPRLRLVAAIQTWRVNLECGGKQRATQLWVAT